MGRYKANKADAVTFNTDPTLTDQSMAETTDINIIVTQFLRTGQHPMAPQGTYADYTQFPTDLREMFETARGVKEQVAALPKELRGIPLEELVNMTNEQITAMLPKPASEPAKEPTT